MIGKREGRKERVRDARRKGIFFFFFCPFRSYRISLILLTVKCLFTQKYVSYFIPERIQEIYKED